MPLVSGIHIRPNDVAKVIRETSNKALNAINEMHLVPFLTAFLENRQKLPSRTVAAAGELKIDICPHNAEIYS